MSATLSKLSEPSASRDRDILRFIGLKDTQPSDDLEISGLLLQSFTLTNRKKLPNIQTDDNRIIELLSIQERRNHGIVRAIELGRRLVGTYSLLRPYSAGNQSKLPESAHLRCVAIDVDFQGLGLGDVLLQDAIEIAKRWEAPSVTLEVFSGAFGLNKFYTRHGFERCPQGDYQKGAYLLEAYILIL